MEQQLATNDVRDQLTERERKALDKFERSKEKYHLSLDLALGMYELFLNGHSCEEIYRVAKKQRKEYPLGAIVDAAIRYEWHDRRKAHLETLFDGILLKTKQTQAEAVSFLTDLLAAAHKQHGDTLKDFIQTGDLTTLSPKTIHIDSFGSYRQVMNLLLQVTGQSTPGKSGPQVNVNVVGGPATEIKTIDSTIKPNDAMELLKLLSAGDEDVK